MAGVGPIEMCDITNLMAKGLSFEKAKVEVFKEFLRDNLGYIETELNDLSIMETKFATKGEKILYVAMLEHKHVKGATCQTC